jgi:hypothetical protein
VSDVRPEPPRSFHALPAGACPDCGLAVEIAIGADGQPFGLVHVMPMCSTFERMDPADFVHWMRVIREGAVA